MIGLERDTVSARGTRVLVAAVLWGVDMREQLRLLEVAVPGADIDTGGSSQLAELVEHIGLGPRVADKLAEMAVGGPRAPEHMSRVLAVEQLAPEPFVLVQPEARLGLFLRIFAQL
jgi:hypothetical protein